MKNTKKTRRVAAFAAAVMMAACVAVPMSSFSASAETTKITEGSITITTTEQDHTYSAYQIFDANLSKDSDTGAITFSDVDWGSGMKADVTAIYQDLYAIYVGKLTTAGETAYTAWLTTEGNSGKSKADYIATLKDAIENAADADALVAAQAVYNANVAPASNAAEVAEALQGLADGTATTYTIMDQVAAVFQKYIGTATVTTTTWTQDLDTTTEGDQSGYKISISDPGYYLVIDSAKNTSGLANGEAISKYILRVAGDETLSPKADAPQVMKKVKEDDAYTGNTNQTVAFGQQSAYALDDNFNDVADYDMGQVIDFTLYGSLPTTFANYKGYYYQFTDTMDAGFTLLDNANVETAGDKVIDAKDFVVTVTDGSAEKVLDSTQYVYTAVMTGGGETAKQTGFTITIADLKSIDMDTATEGVQQMSSAAIITVDYQAKLNGDAVVGLDGNVNAVDLTYSNNSNTAQGGYEAGQPDSPNDETGTTEKDKVIVFTYEMDVTKYLNSEAAANKENKGQAGFVLYKKITTGEGNVTTKYAVLDSNNNIVDWTENDKDSSETIKATEIKTDANALVKFIGLDDGTYFLKETTTPVGYNTMNDLQVVIDATTVNDQNWKFGENNPAALALTAISGTYNDTTVSSTGENAGITLKGADNENGCIVPVSIVNKAGSSLPSTGGIGTTLFYVGGGVLVAGAGVLLITKKRAKKDAE